MGADHSHRASRGESGPRYRGRIRAPSRARIPTNCRAVVASGTTPVAPHRRRNPLIDALCANGGLPADVGGELLGCWACSTDPRTRRHLRPNEQPRHSSHRWRPRPRAALPFSCPVPRGGCPEPERSPRAGASPPASPAMGAEPPRVTATPPNATLTLARWCGSPATSPARERAQRRELEPAVPKAATRTHRRGVGTGSASLTGRERGGKCGCRAARQSSIRQPLLKLDVIPTESTSRCQT